MSKQANSKDTLNATSSPESESGARPCASPDGPILDLFGVVLPHVRATASPAKAGEQGTTETYGRYLPGSSQSADLSASLANKLKQLSVMVGSTVYAQTWKRKRTPSGRLYWAHTARGRTTKGSDCIGWPTTKSTDGDKGTRSEAGALKEIERAGVQELPTAASLAGWPTPQEDNANNSDGHKGTAFQDLPTTAKTAGWPTCSARDFKDTPGMATTGTNPDGSERSRLDQLPRVAHLTSGATPDGTNAETGKPDGCRVLEPSGWPSPMAQNPKAGNCDFTRHMEVISGQRDHHNGKLDLTIQPLRLNPAFSLWLMMGPRHAAAWMMAGMAASSRSRGKRKGA